MREEVNKVRLDLMSRIDKLEAERKPKEELHKRIAALEKELTGLLHALCIFIQLRCWNFYNHSKNKNNKYNLYKNNCDNRATVPADSLHK